ncbi:MAG: hypothetical protein ACW97X_06865 [Candidatus Hodarchaeales archaeon]|jgi:phosphomannomutase
MPRWFGSSGIRGSYQDINPEFAMNLGKAVGRVFKKKKNSYIASDIRATSNLLKSCFLSGFTSESGSIVDIGLAPTPVLSYISQYKRTLGIMLTASHNPPSNNGFKLFLNGGECSEQIELDVAKILEKNLTSPMINIDPSNEWKDTGVISHASNIDFINKYLRSLLNYFNFKIKNQKIVLDCANNVPNLVSPYALKNIGVSDLITINSELDSSFPGRPSEPSAVNLQTLKKRVVEENAYLGIAHDGDGDRFAIIDEKGDFVNSTALISCFVDHLDYSDPNRNRIILTSDCTKQAKEIVDKKGGTLKISRIGKNKEYIYDSSILFLAEPNKLIFPELGRWIDGLFPVLKLLELSEGEPISKFIAEYDKRKILRKAFKITTEDQIRIKNLIEELPHLWLEKINEISNIDGIKLYFKDETSVLIRFSGTEPKIKFYIESSSGRKNEQMLDEIIKKFEFHSRGKDC